jgi:Kdo2-lipid IVA lauroyltransferase/acyltransferase
MYYIIYGFLYSISLLPFFILYRISDFIYVIIYYLLGYRKAVVLENIGIAFPEKTLEQKTKIAKQFYKNLIDTFIETIKLLSITEKAFNKRCTIDFDKAIAIANKGKSIQFHSGHQMNWEYVNWAVVKKMPIPFVGIYQALASKPFNRLFLKIRGKYGTQLVSTRAFKNKMHEVFKQQYCIGLAADQNTHPEVGQWLYFFSKPAPFITGPEKGAIKNNTAVIFVAFEKVKRGHYHFSTTVMAEDGATMQPGQLTRMYRDLLEQTITKNPDNYLWSHRRWRHDYNAAYQHQWIDDRPLP